MLELYLHSPIRLHGMIKPRVTFTSHYLNLALLITQVTLAILGKYFIRIYAIQAALYTKRDSKFVLQKATHCNL
jgi:hypothetical protein